METAGRSGKLTLVVRPPRIDGLASHLRHAEKLALPHALGSFPTMLGSLC